VEHDGLTNPIHFRSRLRKPEPWERNLAVLWLAQALSAMGFSFFFPFVPLFIQDLGVTDPGQAALWSGISGGIGGLFMMLSGPFWGILGDRYGRKKNVLRALIGSAIVLAATALVTDVYQLVGFRVMLGLVSGTWVTVMALASSQAPRHKVTFAIGIVQSASFLGLTLGPLIGGALADSIGFRGSFLVTGAVVGLCGLLVLFFVKENLVKPVAMEKLRPRLMYRNFAQILESKTLVGVLMVMILVQIGPTIVMPVLPVFIATLAGSSSAASLAGVAFSLMGLTATVSSITMSRLVKTLGLQKLLLIAFIGAALVYVPLYFATGITQVFILLAALGLFNGGLNTLTFSLVGTSVPVEKQGAAYGTAQSASALAWGAGPLMGGAIAGTIGLRQVFLFNTVALLLTAFLVTRLLQKGETGEPKEAPPVPTAATAPVK
jgi:MFS family permease